MTRAGTPATMAPAGTSLVTTAPAPTSAPAPMVTPPMMVALLPMEAPSSTFVSTICQSASVCRPPASLVARGKRSLMNMTPWPMNTASPMVTPAHTKVWLEILQWRPAPAGRGRPRRASCRLDRRGGDAVHEAGRPSRRTFIEQVHRMIPFLDLKAQYRTIKSDIDAAVHKILDSGQYVLGEEVELFEREFAAFHAADHGVAVNTGTSALHLALLAAGVGDGDEVITVPFTFVATVAAIRYTGARPVFVDVDPVSFTMDVTQIESK